MALREAYEEIGLPLAAVEVIGIGAPLVSKHGLLVTPVVAWIPAQFTARANPTEVASVFRAPLDLFLDTRSYDSADIHWDGYAHRMHAFHYAGERIWGLTAALLIDVATVALGRAPAFEVDVPGAPAPRDLAASYAGYPTAGGPDGSDSPLPPPTAAAVRSANAPGRL